MLMTPVPGAVVVVVDLFADDAVDVNETLDGRREDDDMLTVLVSTI
jgi:hypothetical protein